MRRHLLLLTVLLGISAKLSAQTKIKDGTISSASAPHQGAILELESNDKGVLLPRVALSATTTWGLGGTAVEGMQVYNTSTTTTGTALAPTLPAVAGMYYWNGTRWVGMDYTAGTTGSWALNGNTGTTAPADVGVAAGTAQYWGTQDAVNLGLGTNGITRAIYDQNGNAYGGNSTTAAATGANNYIWGNRDTIVSGSNSALFGQGNKVTGSNNLAAGLNNTITASQAAVFGSGHQVPSNGTLVTGQNHSLSAGATYSAVLGSTDTIVGNTTSNLISGNNNKIQGTFLTNANIVAGASNILFQANGSALFGVNNKDSATASLVAGQSNVVFSGTQYSGLIGQGNTMGRNSVTCFIAGSNNGMVSLSGASSMIMGSRDTISVLSHSNFIGGMGNKIAGGTSAGSSALFGNGNTDSADYAFIVGQGNIVASTMNHAAVVGKYNVPVSGALFTVGNGTFSTRNNAFTVKSASLIMPKSGAAPASPVEGELYFNTTDKKTYVYDGTTWQALY